MIIYLSCSIYIHINNAFTSIMKIILLNFFVIDDKSISIFEIDVLDYKSLFSKHIS